MARTKTTSVVHELLEQPAKKKKKTATKKKAKRPAKRESEVVLERVLERVSAEPPAPKVEPRIEVKQEPRVPALRTARIVTAAGRAAEIVFRGERVATVAAVAEEVEADVLERAAKNRDSVLVEVAPDVPPVIVGVIQTRTPRAVTIKGATVEIEAEREILLKTGRGALRIREDGDIELVGSRIMAMSRGLFRIVGKMLRLN